MQVVEEVYKEDFEWKEPYDMSLVFKGAKKTKDRKR